MWNLPPQPFEVERHPLGFFETVPKPSSEELEDYYAKSYFQQARGSYAPSYSEDELNLIRMQLDVRLQAVGQFLDLSESLKILDVGCGEGWLLTWAQENGHQVLGLDHSDAGVRAHNPGLLPNLRTGDVFALLDCEVSNQEVYGLVWLQNVLEHVTQPLDLLTSLKGVVNSGGLLVVTVPNDFSPTQLAAIQHGHADSRYWIHYPDHLNYFNLENLSDTVEACGWTVRFALSDFPIDWFVFNEASNFVRNPQVGTWAHRARTQISSVLYQQEPEKVLAYLSAAAGLGVGRNLTVFLSKTDELGS